MRKAELIAFINERFAMARRREAGLPPPWTKDPVLASYRFTNVFREEDPVTQFIAEWLRCSPPSEGNHIVTRAALARYINEPGTLTHIGHVHLWEPETILTALKKWRAMGHRVFNPAYIVSTSGVSMDKLDYVIGVVDRVHDQVHLEGDETLEAAANELLTVRGVGTFMAAQIVADLKHTPLLRGAKDWWGWCLPGPGSRKGLNYALGLRPEAPWTTATFQAALKEVHTDIAGRLKLPRPLDAQNLQNCLCEFSKWCRAVDGTGKPKQWYTPTARRVGH